MTFVLTMTINPAIDISTSTKHVVPTQKLRCAEMRRDAGGGGINVARVVRRLGSDATAIYPAGGTTGELLRRLVEAEDVRSEAIVVKDETREDFTVLEQESGNQFRFVLPGPMLTEDEWRKCISALETIDSLPSFVVASGSLSRGVPDDFYARVAQAVKVRGSKLVLDTSGRPLDTAIDESVYLIKPNLRELQELMNAPLINQDAWISASRQLIETGRVEVVVLTLGDRGALLVTRDMILRARVPNIQPVSAIGAGDSFVGGMAWSLSAGHSIVDAFRWGVAAGSAAVLNPRTELCHAEDVKRLYQNIRLVRL